VSPEPNSDARIVGFDTVFKMKPLCRHGLQNFLSAPHEFAFSLFIVWGKFGKSNSSCHFTHGWFYIAKADSI